MKKPIEILRENSIENIVDAIIKQSPLVEGETREGHITAYTITIKEILEGSGPIEYNPELGKVTIKHIVEEYRGCKEWEGLDVSLKIGEDIFSWGFGNNRWYYFNQDVEIRGDKIPNELEIVAAMLWEATFNGFSEFESVEYMTDMTERIECLKGKFPS